MLFISYRDPEWDSPGAQPYLASAHPFIPGVAESLR